MQLIIATNPHINEDSDRRALWEELNNQLNGLHSVEEPEPDFDPGEFSSLKVAMADNPRIVIK